MKIFLEHDIFDLEEMTCVWDLILIIAAKGLSKQASVCTNNSRHVDRLCRT